MGIDANFFYVNKAFVNAYIAETKKHPGDVVYYDAEKYPDFVERFTSAMRRKHRKLTDTEFTELMKQVYAVDSRSLPDILKKHLVPARGMVSCMLSPVKGARVVKWHQIDCADLYGRGLFVALTNVRDGFMPYELSGNHDISNLDPYRKLLRELKQCSPEKAGTMLNTWFKVNWWVNKRLKIMTVSEMCENLSSDIKAAERLLNNCPEGMKFMLSIW